jgi:hypothetical protein
MSTVLLQQLLNILQAANVEAVKAEQKCDHSCKSLVTSLFFASGATFDGSPATPPDVFVGDYLVFYDDHGVQAFLTRAQVEVINDYFGTCDDNGADAGDTDSIRPKRVSPVGFCTDPDNNDVCTSNVPQSMCLPPKIYSQTPCPPRFDTSERGASSGTEAARPQGTD